MNGERLQKLDAQLATAARLEQMGVVIRSPELVERAKSRRAFVENGGNRAMRRSAARARRRNGST